MGCARSMPVAPSTDLRLPDRRGQTTAPGIEAASGTCSKLHGKNALKTVAGVLLGCLDRVLERSLLDASMH